jgi:Double zinc ribbon
MKCPRCGAKNDPKNKFCSECGGELQSISEQAFNSAGLIGHEVEVLFFNDTFSNKIGGIVNPSPDQIGRYKHGIVQKVVIQAATEVDETAGTVLTFIKQSKEYLGEDYNENTYKSFSHADLKKEYLKLFERVLKMKAQRNIGGAPEPPKN